MIGYGSGGSGKSGKGCSSSKGSKGSYGHGGYGSSDGYGSGIDLPDAKARKLYGKTGGGGYGSGSGKVSILVDWGLISRCC